MASGQVKADEFEDSSSFHSYQGGYYTETRHHWTSYSERYLRTVGAGIKILNYNTEVAIAESVLQSNLCII